MPISQDNLPVTITTPLEEGALRVESVQGEEQLSGLFHFFVEAISLDNALVFDDIIGQSATVKVELPGDKTRYINGIVTSFVQGLNDGGATRYHLELQPWFWYLTLATDCKIYQNKTVPQIVEAIFGDLGFTDYTLSLNGTYTAREYCVQYRETTFDFINRLLEEEGICYFFKHEDGKHTMVLADDASQHPACPELSTLNYQYSSSSRLVVDQVTDVTFGQTVVGGAYAHTDYNFETPATALLATATMTGPKAAIKRFDYPGKYTAKATGDTIASVRAQSLEAMAKMLTGATACPSLTAGHTFTLAGHDRDDVNGDYLVCRVRHGASQQRYDNVFEALPATVPYRPPLRTRKPVIHGAQTAVVVGKSGEEIWTDSYGRVVIQFHWDRDGARDEKSSCWVRVAQGWAGKSWGSFFLPRVGQEVIVTFLDGDPDRPIITGTVYNATQALAYTLPADQTKSWIKTNSSKGGGAFNELRFEDKKDSEEVYLHAAKDLTIDVVNNQTSTVKMDRSTTISEGNDSLTVTKGNRTVKVEAGNETHEVAGTRTVKVTKDETHTNEAKFTQNVTGDYVLKVTGNLTIEADGDVTIKSAKSLTAKSGTDLTVDAGAGLTAKAAQALTNKAGTALTNEAGTSLKNKAGTDLAAEAGTTASVKGNASVTVESSGMTNVKGSLVKLN